MKNIGILGAMAQEIDEVKALLTEKTIVKIANSHLINTGVRGDGPVFHWYFWRPGRWLEGR